MTKTLSSLKTILALLLFSLPPVGHALPQDSVTIRGRVTDPTYQIYVRPMSLTRHLQWQKKARPEQIVHKQDNINNLEQKALRKQAEGTLLAPPADKLKATVRIDGEEVPILMTQEIKEYFDATEYGNAYLLTVDMPKQRKSNLPYRIFQVELTDLENGDRGEGLYYMEREDYVE